MVIDNEISTLISKKVIVPVEYNPEFFISNVFTVSKKDGGVRMILNLKKLNESVKYKHCKLESLNDVLDMMQPNSWMGSIDLKDAYYSIPIHSEFQKFFTLMWKEFFLSICCTPQWFCTCSEGLY